MSLFAIRYHQCIVIYDTPSEMGVTLKFVDDSRDALLALELREFDPTV